MEMAGGDLRFIHNELDKLVVIRGRKTRSPGDGTGSNISFGRRRKMQCSP